MKSENYKEINKQTWNNKVAVHVDSDFYDMKSFLEGKNSLPEIDRAILGDVKNKSILHLQCHFGQDTLSLARLGANCTGIDLSEKAIEKAQELNQQMGLKAKFICCDVYDTPKYLDEKFDIVYTSYGTIGWFPDLNQWAKVISHFLKPNGKLVFVEFHPVVWMFDNDFKTIFYNYFNVAPIVEDESGTYADRYSEIAAQTITWNHPISEVLTALLENGLSLTSFKEYDYSPYNCFNQTHEFEKGKFRIKHLENKIPVLYSLVGKKNKN